MSGIGSFPFVADSDDATVLMLKSHEDRLAQLEKDDRKTLFQRVAQNANAGALFLGLVLTCVTLYDALWVKPEAERIARLSHFNQAVNSAAAVRRELLKASAQTQDDKLRLALASEAATEEQNYISTAKAVLRDLSDDQVGISQLTVLFAAALNAGDIDSAKEFSDRAINLKNQSPFLRSEALRLRGEYLFLIGDAVQGRQQYLDAVKAISGNPGWAMARAYDLQYLTISEYGVGDCNLAKDDLELFASTLKLPQVTPEARSQMAASAKGALLDLQNQHCRLPQDLDSLLGLGSLAKQ